MEKELNVAVVATHVEPALGYGGVPVTAAVLTRAWSSRGRRMEFIASDSSVGGRISTSDVHLGSTVKVGLYRAYLFKRWGFGLGAIPMIVQSCARADYCYIHGIATWPVTLAGLLCWILNKCYIIAPRGGLMPEHIQFVRTHKPHKWLYYRLLTFPALRRAAGIHCTSKLEVEGVHQVIGDMGNPFIVPNSVEFSHIPVTEKPVGKGITICFLGHVQQEKGINAFIRAWNETRRPDDRLIVAGRSFDKRYLEEFMELVSQAEGAIDYRGYLAKEGVWKTLAESHFLVLASGLEAEGGMRENFGNVVAEALAAGRPVLVARGLVWDCVEQEKIGFVFDRNRGSVKNALEQAFSLTDDEWRKMSKRARDYVERELCPVALGDRVWARLTAGI